MVTPDSLHARLHTRAVLPMCSSRARTALDSCPSRARVLFGLWWHRAVRALEGRLRSMHEAAASGTCPGEPHGRRPGRQRCPGPLPGPPRPRPQGPTWSPSPRWCSPATRSRTWRCAPRSSTPAGTASTSWPPTWSSDGLGELPVVVGYLDRVDRDGDGFGDDLNVADRPRVGVPKGEPQNCAAVLRGRPRSSPATPSTTCPTTGSSTSSGSSSRAATSPSCGCATSTSRSPSARTSGRRAAPSPRPGPPAPSCCWCSTAPPTSRTRTTSGSTW